MSVTKLNLSGPALQTAVATFTHTEGTAEETFTIGGYIVAALVQQVLSSGELVSVPETSVSISRDTTTGISTVTINKTSTVADGRILVWYIPS